MSCIHIFLSILTVLMISSLNYWYYSCFLYCLSFSYRASNVIVFKFKSIFSPNSLSLFSHLLQERVQNVQSFVSHSIIYSEDPPTMCVGCAIGRKTKSLETHSACILQSPPQAVHYLYIWSFLPICYKCPIPVMPCHLGSQTISLPSWYMFQ